MSHISTTGLDHASCLRLLPTRSSGRLIFTRQTLPDMLSISYRLDGDNILIRLAGGQAPALQNFAVAFEINESEDPSDEGWTITVMGRAHEIVEPGQRLRLTTDAFSTWAREERNHILSVTVENISGHRFNSGPSPA